MILIFSTYALGNGDDAALGPLDQTAKNQRWEAPPRLMVSAFQPGNGAIDEEGHSGWNHCTVLRYGYTPGCKALDLSASKPSPSQREKAAVICRSRPPHFKSRSPGIVCYGTPPPALHSCTPLVRRPCFFPSVGPFPPVLSRAPGRRFWVPGTHVCVPSLWVPSPPLSARLLARGGD